MNGFLSGTIQQMGGGGVGQAGSFKMTYSAVPPYCEECETLIEEDDIYKALKDKTFFTCRKCNHAMPVRNADYILEEFHPKIIGVINDSYGVDSDEKNVNKDSMIVFKCMTCGAGLNLDDKTNRTIKCRYCNNENYLPDNIWHRLHPNEEVEPFFVLMDLDESDIQSSADYFLGGSMMTGIYIKHLNNFINEIFQKMKVSDSLKLWFKIVLNIKPETIKVGMNHREDLPQMQKHFYDELSLGIESQNAELKQCIAENVKSIPSSVQALLAKDKNENVRLSLAKNPSLEKDIIKQLRNDASTPVSSQAKKLKTGFLGGLFR